MPNSKRNGVDRSPSRQCPYLERLENRDLPSFIGAASYNLGASLHQASVADMNEDGDLDIIASVSSLNQIGVGFGRGDGTLERILMLPACNTPEAIIATDLNADANLDLLGTCHNGLSIRLGNGDGTFMPDVIVPTTGIPRSVAVVDLDGDGRLDVVTSNENQQAPGHSISVFLGNGDGSVTIDRSYSTDPWPNAVVTADFDSDGNQDVAVAYANGVLSQYGGVNIFLGNGDGRLKFKKKYSGGFDTKSLAVGDFNEDGKMDLVMGSAKNDSNNPNKNLFVLTGNGDGTFKSGPIFAIFKAAQSVTVADMNNDGNLDLIVGTTKSDLLA